MTKDYLGQEIKAGDIISISTSFGIRIERVEDITSEFLRTEKNKNGVSVVEKCSSVLILNRDMLDILMLQKLKS